MSKRWNISGSFQIIPMGQIRVSFKFSQLMSQQLSAPVGIDLGSYTSKIAVAKRGGVEVITNEANFRETPCVVGYGLTERNIGEAGSIKMKSNFKDSISAPMRFMGLQPDFPALKTEKKFCPAKCIEKDGKVAFEVNYQGQMEQLYPEQVLAAYINKLKLTLQRNNFSDKSAVVAVPSYLTQQERKAFFEAAKIAQLQVIRLINDSTAIALDYGMFRKSDLDPTVPRNVLFIDFGHSKLSVFACSFTQNEMNVLEQDFCRQIGCRDIDHQLFSFYRGLFQKSSGGSDLSESKKAIVKLMENIQKQRKILSGNIEHDLNIEYLMDESDLNYTMTRDQFEKICEPIFKSIVGVLGQVRDNLKKNNISLHSIQLVGGGSRIPAFLSLVKSVFNIDASRTLNSSQSVARGCALMAAIKSPLFKVPDFTLNEKVLYGVKFFWNFVEGEKYLGLNAAAYPEKQQRMIYEAGARVPTSKTIKFMRKEAIEVLIQYEPVIAGFKKHIGYFVTKPQNPKEENFAVSFKIRYNQDGLVTFEECSLVEEWFQETKIPKKKKEEAKKEEGKKEEGKKEEQGGAPQKMQVQEEFDIKKIKKERFSQIKYDSNTFDAFTSKEIENYFSIESTMLNQDKMILETYEKKNLLESLAYNWKEKLLSSHSKFIKQEEVPAIVRFLEEVSEWLYGEGQTSSRGVFNQKIEAIKSKISGVEKRYLNFEQVSGDLKQFQDCLKLNFDSLNSLDKKYEHITPEDRQEGFSLIERMNTWLSSEQEKQTHRPLYQDLLLSCAVLREKARELNDLVKKIMSKPVPKVEEPKKDDPKKDQPKKDENADDKMDVEPASTPLQEKMEVE